MTEADITRRGGAPRRFDVQVEADRRPPGSRTTFRWTRGGSVARPAGTDGGRTRPPR